jgi:hypothetical protein
MSPGTSKISSRSLLVGSWDLVEIVTSIISTESVLMLSQLLYPNDEINSVMTMASHWAHSSFGSIRPASWLCAPRYGCRWGIDNQINNNNTLKNIVSIWGEVWKRDRTWRTIRNWRPV